MEGRRDYIKGPLITVLSNHQCPFFTTDLCFWSQGANDMGHQGHQTSSGQQQGQRKVPRERQSIYVVTCPICLLIHSGNCAYRVETAPGITANGISSTDTEMYIWVIPQPIHIKFGLLGIFPKDTVLFNCIFWDKASSSTGWKGGM